MEALVVEGAESRRVHPGTPHHLFLDGESSSLCGYPRHFTHWEGVGVTVCKRCEQAVDLCERKGIPLQSRPWLARA